MNFRRDYQMPSQGLRACGRFCHLVSAFFCGLGQPSFLLTDSLIQVFLGHFITVSLLLCQIRVIGL